jgi:hypothetical protein
MAQADGFFSPTWTSSTSMVQKPSQPFTPSHAIIAPAVPPSSTSIGQFSTGARGPSAPPYYPLGGEWGLVSLPVFKTGEASDPRLVSSILIRLRHCASRSLACGSFAAMARGGMRRHFAPPTECACFAGARILPTALLAHSPAVRSLRWLVAGCGVASRV